MQLIYVIMPKIYWANFLRVYDKLDSVAEEVIEIQCCNLGAKKREFAEINDDIANDEWRILASAA